jgi:ElaB/YqjD/DUF883 family membrane-anchored ribosome-binding protein
MNHQDKRGEEQGGSKTSHRVATPTTEAVIEEAEQTIGKAADGAREQIKNAQERAKEALGTAEKEATVLLAAAKERLAPLDSWVKNTTREHPYVVVSSVMGASFLAGFLMRRRVAVGAGIAIGFVAGCLISGSGVKAERQPRKA